jgi:two-component sensor histidine kinase
MGGLIRAFDWASSPIGIPEKWPASLRATVRLMLSSQHPMCIWWGPDYIQLYNDAYRQTLDDEMHPAALGASGPHSLAHIWPIIGPQIELVMAGRGATWNVDHLVPTRRNGRLEDSWWTYGFSPIDLNDAVGGVLVLCTDVTKQHLNWAREARETARLSRLFEQAPGFIALLNGPNHVIEMTNAAYRRLVGDREVDGMTVREALPDLAGQGIFELLDQVYATGEAYVGRRVPIDLRPTPDAPPRRHYLDFIYQALRDAEGRIDGIFVEGQDVTDHALAEDRLRLVNDELRHRVKNTLAMIGAIANQTLREATEPAALAAFNSRLTAFASAHDALTGDLIATGQVADVIGRALMPHIGTENYRMSGSIVEIGSKQALSLALAVHELATNAAKYGATSVETGRVDVRWWIDPEADSFHLTWQETGGPAVSPPAKRGFGSRILTGALAAEFDGKVESRYEETGLVFVLTAPLNALGVGGP